MQLTRTSRTLGVLPMPSQLLAESRKTLKRHAFSSPDSHAQDATILPFPSATPPENVSGVGQRYGEGGTKWGALGAILIIHVLLIGALLTAKMVIERKAPPPELKTFALQSDPLPPRSEEHTSELQSH